MKNKSASALRAVATAARLAGLEWEDFARVVPQRVQQKATFGMSLTVHNPAAESQLNALQRAWGAALLDLHPGDPQFTAVAGWKLLLELGWPARLWSMALAQAVMLEERAALAEWPLLHQVLECSRVLTGAWMHAVQEIRDGFAIPPFDRGAALRAPSRAAKRARLRQYRLEVVEPRIFAATEEEIANERQKPQNSLYTRLHPGRGPVAAVLKNNEWGGGDVGRLPPVGTATSPPPVPGRLPCVPQRRRNSRAHLECPRSASALEWR